MKNLNLAGCQMSRRRVEDWSFGDKQNARRETIIDAYRRAFVGQRCLPAGKQYWTMAGRQTAGGVPLVGGEVHQMLKSGLITPKQYRGVDTDAETITANLKAWPELTFIEGDFFDAMNSAEVAGEFDPGVVNLDTYRMTNNRNLTHALSRILNLLEGHDGVLLVVNGVAKNWVRNSGGYDEVLGQVWDLLDGGRWSQVPLGERRERVYEYTGKAASTTMCTMALCKGGTGMFSEPRPEGGVTTLKYTDPITLRPMQKEAFRALRREPLRISTFLPGSSDSSRAIACMTRVLPLPVMALSIAAPQRDIGMGFRRCRIRVGRRVLVWNLKPTGLNLCDDPADSVDEVYRFLLRAPATPGNAVMVCCHQSLTLAWERIRREGLESKAIRNLSLWIDEAHRVMSPGSEDGDGNALGRAIGPMLRTKSRSARLGLVTATPCRGDGMPIVCEANLTRFAKFECDLERHWRENLPSIDSFSYDFVTHSGFDSGELADKLESVLSDRMRTLVYIPAEGRGSEGGKAFDLRLVLEAIDAAHPGADVVDLCTPATQKANQRALVERLRSDEPDDPDYVVAVNMMKMGSDWPNLQRVIDLKPARSRPDAAQRFGRLTREPKGGAEKRHISYVSFIEVEDEPDGDKLRDAVSAKFAELVAMLLLKLDIIAGRLPGRRRRRDTLVSDDPDFPDFAFAAMQEMEGAADEEGKLAAEAARELLDDLMDRRGVSEDKQPAYRRTVFGIYAAMMGNASELVRDGFDMMSVSMSGMRRFLTGALGRGVLARFREVYRARGFTEEQVVGAIKARIESEPGWWPSCKDATQIPGLPGTSCQQLDKALIGRLRGFTREDDSLFRMLRRNGISRDPTETQVCTAIRVRMESESGWIPSVTDNTQIPGLPPGTSCKRLNAAICRCQRGFTREDDSLSRMLQRNGIVPDAPDYTEAQVVAAIKARMASETNWYPSAGDATQIPGLPPGTNCHQLDMAIRNRCRGFTREGDSLLRMLQRNGALPPNAPAPAEVQVVAAIKARMASEPGWYPSCKDATQIPSLPPGTNCHQLDVVIRNCQRGFTREGDSLYMMLLRNGVLLPEPGDLSEAQVVAAIRARIESEPGWWPSCKDATQIPGLPPGTSCKTIDGAIRHCYRGFTREGDSLVRMLQRNGLLPLDAPDCTESQVVAAIKARMVSELGWYPSNADTTQIPGLPPGTTCQQLNAAIRQCNRGFTREGDSLPRMLQRNGYDSGLRRWLRDEV